MNLFNIFNITRCIFKISLIEIATIIGWLFKKNLHRILIEIFSDYLLLFSNKRADSI